MSHWNHRVLVHDDELYKKLYFAIHEVNYDDKDLPIGYTEKGVRVGGDSIEDIEWTLDMMRKCLNQPILWAGDRFPQEYVAVNTTNL